MSTLRGLLFLFLCMTGLWASERPAAAQNCTFSVSAMSFGSIQTSTGTAFDSTATLTANCSGFGLLASTAYICAHFGDGSGGSIGSTRTMDQAGNKLRFNLYTDAGRSTMWGSAGWQGTGPELTVPLGILSGTGTRSWTIYGRVLAGQQSAQPSMTPYTSSLSGIHVNFRVGTTNPSTCTENYGSSATTQPNLTVSATVLAACTITTSNVTFPNTGLLDANVDAQGAVRVTCSNSTGWSATFDVPSGETSTTRRMYNGSNSVLYGLYKDASRSQPLGTASGQTISGVGNGSAQSTTVYGRVPPQDTPPAGTYTDTVIVTLTY